MPTLGYVFNDIMGPVHFEPKGYTTGKAGPLLNAPPDLSCGPYQKPVVVKATPTPDGWMIAP